MTSRQTRRRAASVVRHITPVLAMLALGAPTLSAQMRGSDEVPVDAAKRAEIIDSVTAALGRVYVFPEVADEMDAHVRRRMDDGAYDDVPTVALFADVLTRDLREISHDLHLSVRYASPEVIAQMSDDRDDAERERERRAALARSNYQFKRVEILPGNVGYLRFDGFVEAALSGPTAVGAMNFLANTDALIIDLRYNGGGSPSLIQLITSYFFAEPVHLNSFYVRDSDSWQQFWTQAHVDGPRLTETDLYVLTSDRTFSAAEEFTYNLRNLERATIVGDTTGGGAHPVRGVLFPHLNVGMSLPFGRAVNPITNTNWEGVGVIPHVDVPADDALDHAHLLALRKIRDQAGDEAQRAAADWAITAIEARVNPVSVEPATLASYAGSYGPRTLTFEDGELYYQREGRPRMRMIPMTESLFRFEEIDYFRLEVVTDAAGRPVKLIGHYEDGRQDESERTATS